MGESCACDSRKTCECRTEGARQEREAIITYLRERWAQVYGHLIANELARGEHHLPPEKEAQ